MWKSSSGGQRLWPVFPGWTGSDRSHCINTYRFDRTETDFSKQQHMLRASQLHSRFAFSSLLILKAWNPDPCRPWQAVPRAHLRWRNVAAPLCTFSMSRGSSLKRYSFRWLTTSLPELQTGGKKRHNLERVQSKSYHCLSTFQSLENITCMCSTLGTCPEKGCD